MTSTPNTMEDALRETLLAMREDVGWGCETMAAKLREVRVRSGRPSTVAHTTIRDYETHSVPRGGWDLELLPDYAEVFGTTVDAIWMDAAVRFWGKTRLRTALRRALEG